MCQQESKMTRCASSSKNEITWCKPLKRRGYFWALLAMLYKGGNWKVCNEIKWKWEIQNAHPLSADNLRIYHQSIFSQSLHCTGKQEDILLGVFSLIYCFCKMYYQIWFLSLGILKQISLQKLSSVCDQTWLFWTWFDIDIWHNFS